LLAFWLVGDARARLRSSLAPIAAGYLIGGVLAAPLLVYVLHGGLAGSFSDAPSSRSDLANFVLPTRVIGIGGSSFASVTAHFPHSDTEAGAYLGLPTLLIVVLFALRGRRGAAARFLVASLLVLSLIALGTVLQVDGHKLFSLPWALVVHLPLLDNAGPARFTV